MEQKKISVNEAIEAMLKWRGKPAVTIIIPLLHATPDHHEDWDRIDRLINEAIGKMDSLQIPSSGTMRTSLKTIAPLISFNRHNKGLGIYISEEMFFMTFFPFIVEESTCIADTFQMKELFKFVQFSTDSMLMTLSSKKVRLFRLNGSLIEEINDHNFPLIFKDDFEYERPSRSTSYAGSAHLKSFEKDRSVTRKKRMREFLKKADDLIADYLVKGRDFILSGTATHIAEFRSVTRHGDYFKNDMVGGYDWYDAVEYSSLIAPLLQKRKSEKIIDLLEYYSRRAGEGFAEYGMSQVWNAVRDGKVETLLLEIGYETGGFIRKGKSGLFETGERPFSDHDYFPLAVNELAQLAALQGAKVFFLDKGLMPAGSHAVAVCRY